MEVISEISLEMTRWLQQNYPDAELFFAGISFLIHPNIFLIILPLIYWSLYKKMGKEMIYLLLISIMIGETFKQIFRDPRPYWLDPEIGLAEETSYGVPSGHALMATIIFGYIGLWFRRSWIWLLAIISIGLTMLSRIFLGVHDIQDVLGGFLLGAFILALYILWLRYGIGWFRNRILGQRLLMAVSIPFILGIIYVVAALLIGEPDLQVAWTEQVRPADAIARENLSRVFGSLLGFSIGFVLEPSRVRLLVEGPVWKRTLRYLVGIVGAAIILYGLGSVIPEEPEWLLLFLQIVLNLLLGLWLAYYAPMIFVKSGLADASHEPETTLSI